MTYIYIILYICIIYVAQFVCMLKVNLKARTVQYSTGVFNSNRRGGAIKRTPWQSLINIHEVKRSISKNSNSAFSYLYNLH